MQSMRSYVPECRSLLFFCVCVCVCVWRAGGGSHCQILNGTLPNLQLHIVKSPFSHLHFPLQTWQVYIILRPAQNFRTAPQKIHWLPNYFLKFFLPNLCVFGLFSFAVGGGACISGLSSYLLAYILTNVHTHLLKLHIHLPTYLPRCKPLSSPTYNLGYQLMTKFASLQVRKFTKLKTLEITN
jgi:hypothetical protein